MKKFCRGFLSASAAALAALCVLQCPAAIELLEPVGGAEVALVPDAQKKVMSLPTLAERLELFAEDRAHGKVIRHDKYWRKSRPLVLKWRTTEGEKGPWKVEIGTTPDLSDARVWFVRVNKVDKASGRDTDKAEKEQERSEVSYTVPMANLEIARGYYWRVSARGRCKKFNCSQRCGCKESKRYACSKIAAFRTEDFAPRWIEINGDVGNIRDLGGWRTTDGRRVRQGMVFRGRGLNSNSVTGEKPGRNRLTAEDLKYLTRTLGIRTDLDLRSKGEIADMAESPLGPGVNFVNNSSASYVGIFSDKGKKTMAENFRLLCNPTNYPVYVHCIGGADRTGSLAYVLNGVLGVDRRGLETDWESTFYPNIPDANPDPNYWCRESHFDNGFSKYGKEGDSLKRRIELYLLDCGVTADEIAAFRSIMLE
jgi:protein-tyrosine phosphatase